jgi:hypothetical protein
MSVSVGREFDLARQAFYSASQSRLSPASHGALELCRAEDAEVKSLAKAKLKACRPKGTTHLDRRREALKRAPTRASEEETGTVSAPTRASVVVQREGAGGRKWDAEARPYTAAEEEAGTW